jgi:enterochelin esterase family protein
MRWVPDAEQRGTPSPDIEGLAIAALVEGSLPSETDVRAFLEGRDFPLVEGNRCTFAYHGPAVEVRLRHWVYGLSTSEPLRRIPGTDLWWYVLEIPDGSRIEYKLEVRRGADVEWIQDPLNPRQARDPFGANSVAYGPGYEVPVWTRLDPAAPGGSLEDRTFDSAALGATRTLTIYRPPRFKESRRYPLLMVHDGGDYMRYAALQVVLDNLIHRLEIPALVAVLMHPPNRLDQYRASEAHGRYVAEELLPHLETELPLVGSAEGRCLMGASLGAVASLATAVQYPGVFGRLLLQSGSFAFSDIGEHGRGPVFDPVADFVNGFRKNPSAVSSKVFLSCGTYESLIYENRSLVPLLERTGMDVRFVEARDGHNWENWRDRLREGLSWLFPGPLWLVYD